MSMRLVLSEIIRYESPGAKKDHEKDTDEA